MRKLSEIEAQAVLMYGRPNMNFVAGAEIVELVSALREAMRLLNELAGDGVALESAQWDSDYARLRERVKP